ncbi:MAG: B12-binding domain-containing radical SAM protein, partial [Kosmotogaceae bacterium]|nr:B12-binding domain-containing radical SAM protein [Kosmotogaceae bacterium]
MKVLMVYPEYPETFWSFKHALKFVSKKAAYPPLGLMTVSAMLPEEWERKLIDMNTDILRDQDILGSDYVMISSMDVQLDSAKKVIQRCKELGVKTIAGGPLFTTRPEEFNEVDHLVLGEAEVTLAPFLNDLEKGHAKHIYRSDGFPDISDSPIPDWKLLDMRKYSSMNIQYSRGCPYNCEFCDIVLLNGHIPRTKRAEKLIGEMEALYKAGWRGGVFIVDDNFIGNKAKLKREILPAIAKWMKDRKYPFVLNTEASIDLSDDDELMKLMVDANFGTVFVGIETTEEESLVECGKYQNRNRDLLSSVRKMQEFGLQVQGGFIVGFDHDKPSVFRNMINFIQKSGIVTAMVGVLTAPTGTRLFLRLKDENRIASEFSGNNTSILTNIVPKMGLNNLVDGYYKILKNIYAPKPYRQRVITFLKNYKPNSLRHVRPLSESL